MSSRKNGADFESSIITKLRRGPFTTVVLGAGAAGKTSLGNAIASYCSALPQTKTPETAYAATSSNFMSGWLSMDLIDQLIGMDIMKPSDVESALDCVYNDPSFDLRRDLGRAILFEIASDGSSILYDLIAAHLTTNTSSVNVDVSTIDAERAKESLSRFSFRSGTKALSPSRRESFFSAGASALAIKHEIERKSARPMIADKGDVALQGFTSLREDVTTLLAACEAERIPSVAALSKFLFRNEAVEYSLLEVSLGTITLLIDDTKKLVGVGRDGAPYDFYEEMGYEVVTLQNHDVLLDDILPLEVHELLSEAAGFFADMGPDVYEMKRTRKEVLSAKFSMPSGRNLKDITRENHELLISYLEDLSSLGLHQFFSDVGLYNALCFNSHAFKENVYTVGAWFGGAMNISASPVLIRTEMKDQRMNKVVVKISSVENPVVEVSIRTNKGTIRFCSVSSALSMLQGAMVFANCIHLSVMNLTLLHQIKVLTATRKGGLESAMLDTTLNINDMSVDSGTHVIVETRDDYFSVAGEEESQDTTRAVRATLGAVSALALHISAPISGSSSARGMWLRYRGYGVHSDEITEYGGVELRHYPSQDSVLESHDDDAVSFEDIDYEEPEESISFE